MTIFYRSAARTITATTDGMTHDTFERFEALASRWDLDRPYRDLTGALDAAKEDPRAFVPSRL